ncbi:hypothetical protein [Pectinatus frisingensis]|uniref:hypothetical protein n=1 Tax=Pectinatus frisingensis TaxID=865 RepID=UPI0018C4D9EA|nr:hypothetical protein [Pectinatus frisingensis]
MKRALLKQLNDYRNKKMRQARRCCKNYEYCHKYPLKLEHTDIVSYNAKFFDYLE